MLQKRKISSLPPKVIGLVIISYILPILTEHYLVNSATTELIWITMLIPPLLFSYYYGLTGGLIGSLLSILIHTTWELVKYNFTEEIPAYELFFIMAGTVIMIVLSVIVALVISKRKEKALNENETKYRALFEYANDIVYMFEITDDGMPSQFIEVNPVACRKFGYSREELLTMTPIDITTHERRDNISSSMAKLLTQGNLTFEGEYLTKKGDSLSGEINVSVFTLSEKKVALSIVRDISERKIMEEKIRKLAYHDGLTRLPNRYLFNEYVNQALERARQTEQMLAVLFVDLDGLKKINDSMGHYFGDMLIKSAARRLQKCVRSVDFVSRFGGDEFVIIMEDVQPNAAAHMANKIIHEFSDPFFINEQEVFSTSSIGISVFPSDGLERDTLLKNADTAMYLAKDLGKNNFQFYTSTLSEIIARKTSLENGLRKALMNNEFTVYYQPQVDLRTNKVIAMEALLRWRHPEYGFVSPAEFIPIAEDSGLITSIGKWVLKTACLQNKIWQKNGFPTMRIAVNVSARQFQSGNFVESVTEVLHETDLNPKYLDLEITESVMWDTKEALNIVTDLKRLGVQLSIDDFGTGYSSLSVLKQLPIDHLKIDKSFLDTMLINKKDEALIKAIIEMAHKLTITIIAEGIEEESQLSFLKQNNCHVGQGYYFSRPKPAEEVINNEFVFLN